MHEILNDPIEVRVDFTQNHVRPRVVTWGSTVFQPTLVNLIHQSREGEQMIFYFSVSDDAHFLKLRFNPQNMQWRLVEIYSD